MAFYKKHTLQLANDEYKLILKIENDKNCLQFILTKKNELNECYKVDVNLEEFKQLNKFFRIFDSINECAESLSDLIGNSSPKLELGTNEITLQINVSIPGNKISKFHIILNKEENNSNTIANSLKQEITKLQSKVNDLEMMINKQNVTINEINSKYEKLLKAHESFVQQHQLDFINLRSMLPPAGDNNNTNPNLRSFQEQVNVNNNEQSSIISSVIELNLLSNQFRLMYPGRNVIYNLLYRGSRDTYEASSFHLKCNNIRGTLIIIQTNQGIKFGGFTNETWDGDYLYKTDNTAFIFSLNNNKIYTIKKDLKAIYCSPKYGPVFCGNKTFTLAVFAQL